MTVLTINGRSYDAALTPVDPATGESSPPEKASYNAPFYDELCIQLINPPQGAPRYYIARLESKNDLNQIKEGTEVRIPAATADQTLELEGKVVWIDDEKPDATYPLKVDLKFGYRTKDNRWVSLDPASHHLDPKALKAEILKALNIGEEKQTNRDKWHQILDEIPGLEGEARLDRSRLSEVLAQMPIIGLLADQSFKDKIVKINGNVSLDDGSIHLELELTPPAKSLRPVVHFEGLDKPLPPDQTKELEERIAGLFSSMTPLDKTTIAKGLEAVVRDFYTDEKYSLVTLPDGTKKLAAEYSEDGELLVHVFLAPLPQEIEINLTEYGKEGKIVREVRRLRASRLPVALKKPLNDKILSENREALLHYYDAQGFVAVILPTPPKGNTARYAVFLYPKPKTIRVDGEMQKEGLLPPDGWLKDRFFEKGEITAFSIRRGREELVKWHAEKGHVLREGLPVVHIEGDVLVIEAHPAFISEFKIYYVDQKNRVWDMGNAPSETEGGPNRTFLDEMEQRHAGAVFDRKALQRGLERLKTHYPFYVNPEIKPDKEGNLSIRLFVHEQPAIDGEGTLGFSRIEGGDWGGAGSAALSKPLPSGRRVGGSASYFNDGADNQVLDVGAFTRIRWLDSPGTSLRIGGGVQMVLDTPDSGSPYYHALRANAELDIPRERHHWLGYLIGAEGSVSFDPENPDLENARDLGKFYGGLRVSAPGFGARVTTGPAGTNRGELFLDSQASATHIHPLPGRFYIQTEAKAGVRTPLAGGVPPDQRFRGFNVLPVYNPPSASESGLHHAGASTHIMFPLIPDFLTLGVGCSVLELGGETHFGCGAKIGIKGIELYLTLIDENGFVTPIGVSLSGGFTF